MWYNRLRVVLRPWVASGFFGEPGTVAVRRGDVSDGSCGLAVLTGDTSSSLSLLSLSLSKSSGTLNIPLYIHQLTDARYTTKVMISTTPTILPLPNHFARLNPKIAEVTSKRRVV